MDLSVARSWPGPQIAECKEYTHEGEYLEK